MFPQEVKKAALIMIASVAMLLVVGVLAARRDPLRTAERRAWKDSSIGSISQRVADPAWPTSELALFKQQANRIPEDPSYWLSPRLILMENGEWLAYTNTCNKEDSAIHDFFLARGSDGRWYYSTFHFCKGMIVLRYEDQPKSLAAFEKTYYLRTFDGLSDECLQKTWPPR
jgi:hypothetical protein